VFVLFGDHAVKVTVAQRTKLTDSSSGGSRVGLGGAVAPQTLKLAPPIAPPNTKMLHTQKG